MKSRICIIIVSVAAAALVPGCESRRTDPGDAAAGEVALGEDVALSGIVDEWVGLRTFTLENRGPDLEGELLVVSREPLSDTVYQGVQVRVSGVMHPADVEKIEKELGFDLPAEVDARLREKQRCLVARTVHITVDDEGD